MKCRPSGYLALLLSLVGGCLVALAQESPEATSEKLVVRLEVRDAIGPATSDYVRQGLEFAAEQNARLVLIEMDTPGGLDSAMREIIKDILASDIPVVTWVAPSGARAASAGTYILYASHIAAMAPATNLGAATPVQLGGDGPSLPTPPAPPSEPKNGTGSGDDGDGEASSESAPPAPPSGATAMEKKVLNDAIAYIRGLAELRGRNAEWAERAVREGHSMSASEAVADNVVDLEAATFEELMAGIDGRTVKLARGEVTLDTQELVVRDFEPDWRIKLLATITNPNIAYMLLLAGVYGLLLEGYNPGALVPGIVGAICLLVALFALQVLPVNYAGLGLMLLGVMLMVAEAFAPSFGALGLGGVVAFVIGSVILFDQDVPGFQVARSLIFGVATAAALLMLWLVSMLMRIRRRPVVSGAEQMLGSIGEALEDFAGRGEIFIHGERWRAISGVPVNKGDRVRVTAMDGLTLTVEPCEPGDAKPA